MPASSLDGGPNFSGSRLDVAIANIAQFGNNPTFALGATFPSSGGVVTMGTGDDVPYFSANGTAWEMTSQQGTAAAPITVGSGPNVKISRTESIVASTMPAGNGANNEGNAGIWVSAIGDTANEAQVAAILGTARNQSTVVRTSAAKNPDAAGVQGFANIFGSGIGFAGGGYFEGRIDTVTASGAYGAELRANNQSGADNTYNAVGPSTTMGGWFTSGSSSTPGRLCSLAIGIGNTNATQWDVGIGFTTNGGVSSVKTATFSDDSSAATSIRVNGTHAIAAAAFAAGSGTVVLGGTTAIFSPAILEVRATTGGGTFTPLAVFSHPDAASSQSVRFRNGSGSSDYFVSGGANNIISGSGAGDTGIVINTSGKHWLIGPSTGAALVVGQDGSVVAKNDLTCAAHIVSTASGTPTTTNLGANVTSVTFTGNDVRGTIAVVMSGALAANTRISTNTFAVSYGATSPKVTLVDQTSAVGLAIVNFYVSAQSTGVSFDLACDQALGAGTFTIDYICLG